MGGGLLQLVAYGAQDVYLTGNPQITFFKVVYRRHTNFALESIQQTFNGSVGYGQRVTATISRNGDLISRAYLVIKTTNTKLVPYFGLKVIKHAEVEIGGQKIDKHYSDWMYIWNELSLPVGKKEGYYNMVGGKGGDELNKSLYVPLEFWFCRNIGLALPLIGLQYHEVKINIQFEEGTSVVQTGEDPATNLSASLWVDYIYLDTDERRKFAQSSHEYLIEQLQFTGRESASNKIKLNFNHPVKELVWVVHDPAAKEEEWFNYTTSTVSASNGSLVAKAIAAKATDDGGGNEVYDFPYSKLLETMAPGTSTNPVKQAKLILNGNDRFYARDGRYFNLVQPFQHHENIPNNAGINVYSFALKPEEHQPSGSLNMSRIDTAVLDLQYTDGYKANNSSEKQVSIFAVNYNVLRILSGMGGIAYSN
jgi:hypothetical protein